MGKLTSVINFCSNDMRFLRACVDGVSAFSHQILITVCDHFFDGTQENYALLAHAYASFPECSFIEYAFDPKQSYRRFTPHYPEHYNWRHEWHNTGRWIAYFFLPKESHFIFFLDTDEIVDTMRFMQWLNKIDISSYAALSFSANWYFREARYQSTNKEDCSLIINKKALSLDHLWHTDERAGILIGVEGEKLYHIKGLDQKPLIDHYSWVRTKEELYKKFSTWGHHWERSWKDLLLEEFEKPFHGKDFIRGYTYCTLPPRFDPLFVKLPQLAPISQEQHLKNILSFPHVIRVDKKEMQRREVLENIMI